MAFYKVPEQNLDKLETALAKVAKAARKLGVEEPTLTYIAVEPETHKDGSVTVWHIIEVTGDTPTLAGWTLGAVIQFVADDSGATLALFRAVPDVNVPAALRQITTPWCDHCQTNRKRRDTYLVTDGAAWKQVGSTCLADFLGHANPQMLAAYAEALIDFDLLAAACEDGEEFGGGSAAYMDITTWLIDAARSVRSDGWCSRKTAREEIRASTYDRVDFNLLRCKPHQHVNATAEDKALAEAALAWARGLADTADGLNDYEYNLMVACRPSYAETRTLGIITSLIPAYQRWLNTQAEIAANTSTWQGEVGGKIKGLAVTVTGRFDKESVYGVTHIVKMQDAAGNHYVWFCSSLPTWKMRDRDEATGREGGEIVMTWNPQPGVTAVIGGTVKAHSEWQGVQETILTRCKVQ